MDENRTSQRESFPKFNLVAANAAMDRMPAAVCVFELRERMVGQAFIADVGDESVILHYSFTPEYAESCKCQIEIKTIDSSTRIDRYRRLFECPRCKLWKWSLYLKGTWLCADCHKLKYRSQLVDKEVKLWEERDELRKQIGRGRPKSMQNRTYMKLRQRLFALDNLLSDRTRKFASESHDIIIHSRWVPGDEIDLWSARYAVRGGDFVVRDSFT